ESEAGPVGQGDEQEHGGPRNQPEETVHQPAPPGNLPAEEAVEIKEEPTGPPCSGHREKGRQLLGKALHGTHPHRCGLAPGRRSRPPGQPYMVWGVLFEGCMAPGLGAVPYRKSRRSTLRPFCPEPSPR